MLSIKKMQEIARRKLNVQDTNNMIWKIVTSKAHKLEPNKFLGPWGPGLVNTCAYLATGFVNCLAFDDYVHCTRELIQTLHIEKKKDSEDSKGNIRRWIDACGSLSSNAGDSSYSLLHLTNRPGKMQDRECTKIH